MNDFNSRNSIQEKMDSPDCAPHELFRILDEIHVINEWLGGYDVSIKGIKTLLPKHSETCKLLDVGCGGGELSHHILRWSQNKKILTRYIGIDYNKHMIEYAKNKNKGLNGAEFLCEDLFNMKTGSTFDIVHASLCLHHFHNHHAARALKRMYDMCVYGVVINDLHRHPLAYHSIKTLTAIGSRSEIFKHDAPASVLNAFKLVELYELAHLAGVPRPKITWHWAFRWLMIIPKKSEVKVKTPVLNPTIAMTKTA